MKALKKIEKAYRNIYVEYLIKTKQYKKIDSVLKMSRSLNAGASRRTFKLSDYSVAKVLLRDHSLQSLHEVAFYEKHWKKHKEFMCKMKLHYHSEKYGLVLIMEKVRPLNTFPYKYVNESKDIDDNKREIIKHKMMEFEEETQLVDSSDNPSNWGIKGKNKLVAIDCGISNDDDFISINTFGNCGESYNCVGDCDYCRNRYHCYH